MLLSSATARVSAVRPASQARLMAVRPSVARITRARASSGGSPSGDELTEKASEIAKDLQAKWEKTEDKPGVILVASGTVVALSLAFTIVNAIDKIPIVSDFIELVGIGVTGWLLYRYLTVGPDRDELFISIKEFLGKIYKF